MLSSTRSELRSGSVTHGALCRETIAFDLFSFTSTKTVAA